MLNLVLQKPISIPPSFLSQGRGSIFSRPKTSHLCYSSLRPPPAAKALAMASLGTGSACEIFLFGPLTVLDGAGRSRTPRAQKSRALLALLALAPRGSRSRVWLRDKLWSDRGEEQASASLRQALLDIRKSLGPLADQVLIADKHTITLDLNMVRVDALEILNKITDRSAQREAASLEPNAEFLEGLDICDPEFEEWLTLERQVWRGRFENAATLRDITPSKEEMPALLDVSAAAGSVQSNSGSGFGHQQPSHDRRNQWTVALMPPVVFGSAQQADYLPHRFNALLAKSLLEGGDVGVSDFSHQPLISENEQQNELGAIQLAIKTRHTFSPHHVHTTVSLHRTSDQSLVWIESGAFERRAVEAGDTSQAHSLVNEAIEEVRRWFFLLSDARSDEERETMFGAVNAMFRLSRTDLDLSEQTLRALIAAGNTPQAYAWLAFLLTFRIGQRFSMDTVPLVEEAQQLSRQALEVDGKNAITLALVGHVHSYLFGEYDFASTLFERSITINPAQVLSWDLYSMLHAYAGQPDKGLSLANWGRHLGSYSPYRYYFDTSRCIAASLSGRHDIAVQAGEEALRERPAFNTLLRYLVSSYAHQDNLKAAHAMLERLHAVEPDFSVGALVDAGYPIMQTSGGKSLISGLLKAGAKKT